VSNYQEVRKDRLHGWGTGRLTGRGLTLTGGSLTIPMSTKMDAVSSVAVRLSQANLLIHKTTQTTLKLHATSSPVIHHFMVSQVLCVSTCLVVVTASIIIDKMLAV
jgi:hypothetical protein